jgi:putative glutamine amidotransferase
VPEPLIAVAAQPLPAGTTSAWREDSVALPAPYVRALHRAGAQEGILAPRPLELEAAREVLARFDGVLLIGGADVDPVHYGEEPHPETYGVNRDADAFEMSLLHAAMDLGKPVLAICRGFQVLNVALGGSLDQHITGRQGLVGHGVPGVAPEMHDVRIEAGTWTAKALGTENVLISSSHHQAIGRLAEGLVVTGRAPDGIVEAVERPGEIWVVAVQWHPERTAEDDPSQQGLFEALAEQAARA